MGKREPKKEPNAEQLAALQRFAAAKGRTWKHQLNVCWMRASYPGVPDGDDALLQQVRNALGPSWLVGFRLPPRGKLTPGGAAEIIEERHNEATKMIERVIDSAEAHGQQSGEGIEHQVGDLEGFIHLLAQIAGPFATERAVVAWFDLTTEWTS
jgi:hypothetical protein